MIESVNVTCLSCNQTTRHAIVATHREEHWRHENPEMYVDFADGTFEILRCSGCRGVRFRETWMTSEDSPEHPTVTLYPAPEVENRRAKRFADAPNRLGRIYREAVQALNAGLRTLSAAGLRAVVEEICRERNVQRGPVLCKDGIVREKTNLQGKIEGLVEAGHLSRAQGKTLHEHRFLGNDALHELDEPSEAELAVALDVLESVMDALYNTRFRAELLADARDRRRQRRQ